MEPIHFGDSKTPLFGMHHRSSGTVRRTAVLVCPSWGMEYMRAYRGLRTLSQSLAESGYETLRFDYSGTGDSEGASLDSQLEHWLADISIAAQELLDRSGADHLAVIGVRLGALLAEAARVRMGLHTHLQISWDAPQDGASYVALMGELGRGNDAIKQSRRNSDMLLPPPQANELNAHAWPPVLANAITALPPVQGEASRLWVRSTDVSTPAPQGAATFATGDAAHWDDVRWIGTPWVPASAIQKLVAHLATVLP